MNCQRCLGEIIFPQCLTDQLSTQHEPLNSTQQVLPAALRPPRHSPSCEEAAFEMMGLSENTQLLLSFRGQPQSLSPVWLEGGLLCRAINFCLYKCLGLPQSAKGVSSWDTALLISSQPYGGFSESLQRSSGWQWLWLGLCRSVT